MVFIQVKPKGSNAPLLYFTSGVPGTAEIHHHHHWGVPLPGINSSVTSVITSQQQREPATAGMGQESQDMLGDHISWLLQYIKS